MRKNTRIILLGLLLNVIFGFVGCTSNPQKDELVLEGFNDLTITAELGEFVSFAEYLTVTDSEGESCETSYLLQTIDGNDVISINNEFKAEYQQGYKLTITAKKGEAETSRVITIECVDTTAPIIHIDKMEVDSGYIGEEYALPQFTVFDASGSVKVEDVSLKIYYVNDDDTRSECLITNDKFTPDDDGVYEIEAKAQDSAGNVGTAKREFVVRKYAQVGEIEYFSGKTSVNAVDDFWTGADLQGQPVSWLKNYEGAEGILKLSYNSAHVTDVAFAWWITPRQTMENYAEGDKLVVRAYIPSDSGIKYLQLGEGIDAPEQNWDIAYNEWKDYVFDADLFRTLWTDVETGAVDALKYARFCCRVAQPTNGSFYIDSIAVVKDSDLDAITVIVNSENSTLYPNEKITIAISGTEANTYDVKIVSPDSNIVLLDEENKFTPAVSGEYTVIVTVKKEDFTFEKIETINVERLPATENEVENFDEYISIKNVKTGWNNYAGEPTWLSEYEGANGVIKYDYSGTWPGLYFMPRKDVSEYEGYEEVVVRFYVVKTGGDLRWAYMGGTATTNQGNPAEIVVGEWQEISFPISCLNLTDKGVHLQFRSDVEGEGTIYIDSIYVVDTAANSDVANFNNEESVSKTLSVGTTTDSEGVTLTYHDKITLGGEEKQGVVEITVTGKTYYEIILNPLKEMSEYDQYDGAFVISMYVPSMENGIESIGVVGNDYKAIYNATDIWVKHGDSEYVDKWVEHEIDISYFKTYWGKEKDWAGHISLYVNSTGTYTFYIDVIYVTNAEA